MFELGEPRLDQTGQLVQFNTAECSSRRNKTKKNVENDMKLNTGLDFDRYELPK